MCAAIPSSNAPSVLHTRRVARAPTRRRLQTPHTCFRSSLAACFSTSFSSFSPSRWTCVPRQAFVKRDFITCIWEEDNRHLDHFSPISRRRGQPLTRRGGSMSGGQRIPARSPSPSAPALRSFGSLLSSPQQTRPSSWLQFSPPSTKIAFCPR